MKCLDPYILNIEKNGFEKDIEDEWYEDGVRVEVIVWMRKVGECYITISLIYEDDVNVDGGSMLHCGDDSIELNTKSFKDIETLIRILT